MPDQSSRSNISSSSKRSVSSRKRGLAFANKVAVKLIPTLAEMTDAEYFAMYNTDEEYQAMQRSVKDDVNEMRYLCSRQNHQSNFTDDNMYMHVNNMASPNFCHRGIEHLWSVESNELRRQKRRSYVHAILQEQAIQRFAPSSDPLPLSRTAARLSSASRVEAIRKGVADAAEARREVEMEGEMDRVLWALQDAVDKNSPAAKSGSKLNAIQSVGRPLGPRRTSSGILNAAVA